MCKARQVTLILDQLALELQRTDRWTSEPPSQQDLSSTQPFCVDTLNLTEWLQWIMIPKLNHMIKQGMPLPESSAIHPYAEEAFKGLTTPSHHLLRLLKQLDDVLNQSVSI